ncbi:class I fructose-bisphosphate aldolase [Pseudomonas savastanoi]|nr:class I fructose-bisphosphate aldolase [Pseudomonas savastanoi]
MTAAETIKSLRRTKTGILACDESPKSMAKRFSRAGIYIKHDTRKQYFEMLLGGEDISSYISGIILYEDILTENAYEAIRKSLSEQGILLGVRADQGGSLLACEYHNEFTRGLDSLRDRLDLYKSNGASFVKWRASYSTDPSPLTRVNINLNSLLLSAFARQALEVGLVPIVEVEVLYEGNHDIEGCLSTTTEALESLFASLDSLQVDVNNLILKVNYITPGSSNNKKFDMEEISKKTILLLNSAVPKNIGLVVFLSGGLDSEVALEILTCLTKCGSQAKLTYSFGRAFWQVPLNVWGGKEENVFEAREELIAKLFKASEAVL